MLPFTSLLKCGFIGHMYAEKCKVDVGTVRSGLSGLVARDVVDSLSTQCEKITSQDVCTGS